MAKKNDGLMISRGKNDTSSEEDGSLSSKEPTQASYEGGPETMPEPKKEGSGKPSREQLLANLQRLQAKLRGGGPSINPDELLGRTPPMARPGLAGGPGLPALNPMASPTIDPSMYHGSDAAGPGMGAPRANPAQIDADADKMFKQLQAQREQITPKATPTDDALYREMLRIYGGG